MKRAIVVVVGALLLGGIGGCGWLAPEVPRPPRYYAVIVGINDPPEKEGGLIFPVIDAAMMHQTLLRDPTRWAPERIALLFNQYATKEAVREAITMFAGEATPEDTLLIFFAGHGKLGQGPYYHGFLCTYGKTEGEWIRDDELAAWLTATPFGWFIVLIDACNAGAFTYEPVGGAVAALFAERLLEQVPLAPAALPGIPRTIVVLAASDYDEPAGECPTLHHGVFTFFLIEGLRGAADAIGDRDGTVSAEEAFLYLAPRVYQHMRRRPVPVEQEPQMWDSCPRTEFELLRIRR